MMDRSTDRISNVFKVIYQRINFCLAASESGPLSLVPVIMVCAYLSACREVSHFEFSRAEPDRNLAIDSSYPQIGVYNAGQNDLMGRPEFRLNSMCILMCFDTSL